MRNPSGFCVRIYFELLIVIQIPDCCGEHQLDSVQLIDFRCTWIIINRYDISSWKFMSDFLNNTFSYNMVWQAGKWLCTDDVGCTLMN